MLSLTCFSMIGERLSGPRAFEFFVGLVEVRGLLQVEFVCNFLGLIVVGITKLDAQVR